MRELERTRDLIVDIEEMSEFLDAKTLMDNYLEEKQRVEALFLEVHTWCEAKKKEPRWKKEGFLGDWTFTEERQQALDLVNAYQAVLSRVKNSYTVGNDAV